MINNKNFDYVNNFLNEKKYPESWELADYILYQHFPYFLKSKIFQWIQQNPYPIKTFHLSSINKNIYKDHQNVHSESIIIQLIKIIIHLKNKYIWIENKINEPLKNYKILNRIYHNPFVFYLDPELKTFPTTLLNIHQLIINFINHIQDDLLKKEFMTRYNNELNINIEDICSFGILCRMINCLGGYNDDLTIHISSKEHLHFKFNEWLKKNIIDDEILIDMISEKKILFTNFIKQNLETMNLNTEEFVILKEILSEQYQIYL
jgi:hypothetical protein